MQRKKELFQKSEGLKMSAGRIPPQLIPQERDWTCSLGCIRTICSAISDVPSEEELIKRGCFTPGPLYSEDFKNSGILGSYDVIYGCDTKEASLAQIGGFLNDGYYVMTESIHNGGHWMVLLALLATGGSDLEKQSILLYDPYYDRSRLIIADEYESMWYDANKGIVHDFIAIRKKDHSK